MAKIALTFNGAPQIVQSSEGVQLGTAELLRVIEELSAAWNEPIRVTLFMVGKQLQQMQSSHPELLEHIAQSGHEIGNNSFSHPKNFHQLPLADVLAEVRQTHELITQIFDRPPTCFRPPHGLITSEATAAIHAEFPDYQVVGWDHHDEKGNDTPEVFRDRTVDNATDQQVLLLHDWRKPTLWALRGILTQLQLQGYQFVSLQDLDRQLPQQGLREILPPRVDMPRIAFTFDDDPKVISKGDVQLGTAELLRVIEDLNQTAALPIRVTFFVVGVNLEKAQSQYPEVLQQMKAGGHDIQNHSYSHPSNFHQLSTAEAVDEVRKNHDLITEIFGRAPQYFRPPKGFISQANHRAILKAFPGYHICGWDRHDEKDSYTAAQLRKAVVRSAQDRQIVLLHNWYKNTLWSVRGMLGDLQAKNYQFVRLSDLERQPTLYGLKYGGKTVMKA